jgi:hypothetical protein
MVLYLNIFPLGSVAIRLRTDSNITAGRHFDINDKLASIVYNPKLYSDYATFNRNLEEAFPRGAVAGRLGAR